MRNELKRRAGHKLRFKAGVKDFKQVIKYQDKHKEIYEWQVKLIDVTEKITEEVVVPEIWLRYSKTMSKLKLKEGEWIEFTAKVEEKLEGYKYYQIGIDDRELDYSLKYVSDIVRI